MKFIEVESVAIFLPARTCSRNWIFFFYTSRLTIALARRRRFDSLSKLRGSRERLINAHVERSTAAILLREREFTVERTWGAGAEGEEEEEEGERKEDRCVAQLCKQIKLINRERERGRPSRCSRTPASRSVSSSSPRYRFTRVSPPESEKDTRSLRCSIAGAVIKRQVTLHVVSDRLHQTSRCFPRHSTIDHSHGE